MNFQTQNGLKYQKKVNVIMNFNYCFVLENKQKKNEWD